MNVQRMVALVSAMLAAGTALSMEKTPLVVIMSDAATLSEAGNEIEEYAQSIRREDKRCMIVEDRWSVPDSIKAFLENLYKTDLLEGAVLIGDIPVPMIRDAQHLTTAFKMDQARPKFESSVPSDRFYDDFDLRFDSMGKDGEHSLAHYYSLRADSPQYISCDIYTARIKAPSIPGKTKYEAISECLEKIVREKTAGRELHDIAYFSGHGYNSESLQARVSENEELRRHFPLLKGRISFTNYDRDSFVKSRIQALLEDPDIDIALLHHHGSDDTQYLSNTPYVNSARGYADYLKMFIRGKVRSSKDTAAAKRYYVESYGVPESWTEGAFDPETVASDEAFSAAMDITIADTYSRRGGPAFILHDACFNGSFHLEDYIAGHYAFAPGHTVAVKANSVNTLQDTWQLELIGLLYDGVCIGNWLKNTMTLETHIMGDPTWRFSSGKTGLDKAIVSEKDSPKFWKKMLSRETADRKALAMLMLSGIGEISAEELLAIQKNDTDPVVRLEAFSCIKKFYPDFIEEAIITGLHDSHELHVRFAALTARKNGSERLLPHLAELYFDPALSDRVEFHILSALDQYDVREVEKVLYRLRKDSPLWPSDKRLESFVSSLERSQKSSDEEFELLWDENRPFRKRRITITPQRNECSLRYADDLLEYAGKGKDRELRILAAETLGWYIYSPASEMISETLSMYLSDEKDAQVKNEMEKTINRLNTGINR